MPPGSSPIGPRTRSAYRYAQVASAMQFPRSASALRLLDNLVRLTFSRRPAERERARTLIKGFGREAVRVALIMRNELEKIREARRAVPGAGVEPFPVVDKFYAGERHVAVQIQGSRFPARVQREIMHIYSRTQNDNPYGARNEYAAYVIQLPNGQFLTDSGGFGITSGDPAMVRIPRHELQPFINKIRQLLQKGRIDGDIIIYGLHTHPQNLENPDGVKVHEDGLYYTDLSPADYDWAVSTRTIFQEELGKLGFRGRVEIVACAVPVPLRPLPDLAKEVYVASYSSRPDILMSGQDDYLIAA